MSRRVTQAVSYLNQNAPAAEPVEMTMDDAATADAVADTETLDAAASESAAQPAEQEEDGQ